MHNNFLSKRLGDMYLFFIHSSLRFFAKKAAKEYNVTSEMYAGWAKYMYYTINTFVDLGTAYESAFSTLLH